MSRKSQGISKSDVCGNLVSVGWMLSLMLLLLSLAGGGGGGAGEVELDRGGLESENSFTLCRQPHFCFSLGIFCTAPEQAEGIEHPRVNVMNVTMSLVTFSLGKWTLRKDIHDTRMAHEPRKNINNQRQEIGVNSLGGRYRRSTIRLQHVCDMILMNQRTSHVYTVYMSNVAIVICMLFVLLIAHNCCIQLHFLA